MKKWLAIGALFQMVSASLYAQAVFSGGSLISGAIVSSPRTIFSDGFESGDLTQWTATVVSDGTGDTIGVQSSVVKSGTYALGLHYSGSGEDAVRKVFDDTDGYPNGLPPHFFIKGDFYLPSRGADATESTTTGRKLIFMRFPDGMGDTGYIIVGSWENTTALDSPFQLTGGTYFPAACGTDDHTWSTWDWADNVTRNAWHTVELEVQLNTAGSSDGYLKMWVDGTLTHTQPDISIVGTCTSGITDVRVGEQMEGNNGETVDEDRYWDNVSISTTGP
jgi:hypothetical protein